MRFALFEDNSRRCARKKTPISDSGPKSQRSLQIFLLLLGSTLVANALIGDRGLVDSMIAQRQHKILTAQIQELRLQNQKLREEAKRLRLDQSAIEEVARGELGLIRSGELIFLLNDDFDTPR